MRPSTRKLLRRAWPRSYSFPSQLCSLKLLSVQVPRPPGQLQRRGPPLLPKILFLRQMQEGEEVLKVSCLPFSHRWEAFQFGTGSDLLVKSERVHHPHQVHHGDSVVSLRVNLEGGRHVLDRPQGHLLSDSHSPGLLTLPLDCTWREGLPVQGSAFQPFYSSPGLY